MRWENRNTGKSGYAPACANEWVRGVCGKPQVKCGECPNQAFIALSDSVIASHLRGADPSRSSSADFVAGVYPVRGDETCWFLAVDFDGDDWSIDALAYIETCRLSLVPAALERSRSGKGGHVWIFFSQPIPARDACQLGATLLTETLQRRPEMGFASYDRMFPSQDTLPKGGFGNAARCVALGSECVEILLTPAAATDLRSLAEHASEWLGIDAPAVVEVVE